MKKSNLIRKTFLLTQTQFDRMEALKGAIGTKSYTGVFESALNALWEKQTKYGRDPFDSSTGSEEESIARQANRKIKLQEAEQKIKQDAKDKPKIDICNELGGTLIERADGTKVCEYFVHDLQRSEKRTIPISQLFPQILGNQWIPNKEAVLKARPDIIKKYNVA